ncbi:arginine--tRNA ligase [Planococcus sp. S3-L1]|uniref:arginine--tRNA ligase domain-containing protein n=1 Tax=Planococcus sp. S3-L1 TaxID=3046200 RepID=UPI0024B9A902|nr:arginine--tRNA ligase [Planococcus sp. S3-L1]MDJ0333371.1 arginine--tRNA ligase [Planococcus sp. S3-L1]
MDLLRTYADEIASSLSGMLEFNEVVKLIEQPKYSTQGDIAFPCFTLAKLLKKSPVEIAKDLAQKVSHPFFEKVVAEGPYVNCFYNKTVVSLKTIKTVLHKRTEYGSSDMGQSKVVTLDFSSPNIAKPFSMGHLRSTVIGNSLANISEKCGFQTVRINHLGDWGTQFGKLIAAYKAWGKEADVKNEPISELLKLYVKFHEKAEADPALENSARLWFKKLEDGDEEARKLWEWFRNESLQEFAKIYKLLDIDFDSYNGEAFYNDKMNEIVKLLEEKQLLVKSNGADIVDLSNYNLPPLLNGKLIEWFNCRYLKGELVEDILFKSAIDEIKLEDLKKFKEETLEDFIYSQEDLLKELEVYSFQQISGYIDFSTKEVIDVWLSLNKESTSSNLL